MMKQIKSGTKVEIVSISISLSTENFEARLGFGGIAKWFVF
jgi:hypothetical protein